MRPRAEQDILGMPLAVALTPEATTALYLCIYDSTLQPARLQGGASAVTMGSPVEIAPSDGIAPLADVLNYRNDLVVSRFRKRFKISQLDADTIFVELVRWLWYLASTKPTADNPEAHAIDAPLLIIDEMWHEFIIITRDYTKFCDDMFLSYIHHVPNSENVAIYTPVELAEVKSSMTALIGRKRAKYTSIYDVLGRDVFIRWYLEFPRRFGPEVISRMRKETGRLDARSVDEITLCPFNFNEDKVELIEEAIFMNLFLSTSNETA